jgi:hypothetical protein
LSIISCVTHTCVVRAGIAGIPATGDCCHVIREVASHSPAFRVGDIANTVSVTRHTPIVLPTRDPRIFLL